LKIGCRRKNSQATTGSRKGAPWSAFFIVKLCVQLELRDLAERREGDQQANIPQIVSGRPGDHSIAKRIEETE
jgi:hypothetical protein